ncbi:MAG TPA: succinylglutamate desuccinylase/aspartoacylase family protein [Streptosporangiaceae bacterium]|nr:succinylglutamate desuccinylase/aspartoacylase family protein [Streptosporangiaceae bacterium]
MPPMVLRRTLGLAGHDIPVVELTGVGNGPRLTVLAGVHGCEYAPMAAVRQWTRALAERELRGSVRVVPVLNVPAFRARTPFVVPDDGKNLNRCFPGDPAGTLAERLAYAAFTELIVGSDALVDVHAGDMVEALEPFALYDAGASEAKAHELAAAYGLGYVIRQEPGPDRAVGGTTSTAAAGIGIPAIIAEAGGCGLIEPTAVDAHIRGLDRVLALLGMADDLAAGEAPGVAPTHLRHFLWLRSHSEGWWEPAVRPGEPVAEGQLLGAVSSLDGAEVRQTLSAPSSGVPLFVTSSPAVAADGLLLGLGVK